MGTKFSLLLLCLLAFNVLATVSGYNHHKKSKDDDDDDDDDHKHKIQKHIEKLWNKHFKKHWEHRGDDDYDDYYDDSDESDDSDSHDRDNDHHHKHWSWSGAAGIGVLAVVITVICAGISFITWLSCCLYGKCKKGKIGDSKAVPSGSAPIWASQLVFHPEFAAGFGLVSEGFARIGPSQVVRTRQGTSVTDGAVWAVPMTKGKHIFEITWPWGHRGTNASVGVGTKEAPIKEKGLKTLIGCNTHSWGLDIVKRRTMHGNKYQLVCPTDGSYVPDKFSMYVNMDEGTVGFGNDVTYWGEVIKDLPKDGTQPLFVMIGVSRWQAELSVVYKGSATDGDNSNVSGKMPHHLPPLYSNVQPAPPSYTEEDEGKGEPIMVKPALPQHHEETSQSPPPPYTMPPVGYSHSNV